MKKILVMFLAVFIIAACDKKSDTQLHCGAFDVEFLPALSDDHIMVDINGDAVQLIRGDNDTYTGVLNDVDVEMSVAHKKWRLVIDGTSTDCK